METQRALRVHTMRTLSPPPNLNLVAGSYDGLRADNHMVTVTVDAAGTLSGHSSDECTFAGTFVPRAKGNVFHHAVTFGGGACPQGTETVAGVALYDGATNRLYSAASTVAGPTALFFSARSGKPHRFKILSGFFDGA